MRAAICSTPSVDVCVQVCVYVAMCASVFCMVLWAPQDFKAWSMNISTFRYEPKRSGFFGAQMHHCLFCQRRGYKLRRPIEIMPMCSACLQNDVSKATHHGVFCKELKITTLACACAASVYFPVYICLPSDRERGSGRLISPTVAETEVRFL